MSSNIVNSTAIIRTTRQFPQEMQPLTVELDKMYVDIANAINTRTIGIFTQNQPAQIGESWFISQARKQNTLRQFYQVTGSGNISHGITLSNIGGFTRIYGTFTDGANWYPLPYVDAVNANNQISLQVTTANIVIVAGGGSPPAISSGFVVLEWLAFV